MKLKKISIKNLFGYINTEINFDEDIKIIYGKNGTGKTTILKIIDIIFNKSLEKLGDIVFQEIILEFSNQSTLLIEKLNKNKALATKSDQFKKIYFSVTLDQKEKSKIKELYNLDDNYNDNNTFWITESFEPEHLRPRISNYKPPKLSKIKEFLKYNKVKFIETQRLLAYTSLKKIMGEET